MTLRTRRLAAPGLFAGLLSAGTWACTSKSLPSGGHSGGTSEDDSGGLDGGVVEPIAYVAQEICIIAATVCARIDTGQMVCWGDGGYDPFMLEVEAIKIGCGWVYCAEDAEGAITCVDREANLSTDYNVPPDDILPLTDWWLSEWGGGCGLQSGSTSICWPDTRVYSVCAAGHLAQHVSFTSPFVIMVGTDGVIKSLYKDHDCVYSGKPDHETGTGYTYGLEFPPDGDDFQSVAAGTYHACALDSEGQATCWGLSANEIQPSQALRFVQLSSAYGVTCGVTTEGHIECRASIDKVMPADVPTGDNWTQVVISTARGCALDTDGQVTCFGDWSSYGSTLQDALHADAVVPTAKPLQPPDGQRLVPQDLAPLQDQPSRAGRARAGRQGADAEPSSSEGRSQRPGSRVTGR